MTLSNHSEGVMLANRFGSPSVKQPFATMRVPCLHTYVYVHGAHTLDTLVGMARRVSGGRGGKTWTNGRTKRRRKREWRGQRRRQARARQRRAEEDGSRGGGGDQTKSGICGQRPLDTCPVPRAAFDKLSNGLLPLLSPLASVFTSFRSQFSSRPALSPRRDFPTSTAP
ncbi:hypothetical protein WN48_06182 [Eufriesea mexicana]|uniref:Uncharacterized protein n=1 Tax=Eufriesea mexicana TaxID=516756 RepID=A0A310SSX3_9HYME|nr:hypothetical protein WN48_06182 [Eufriesea mexicana]